MLQYMQNVCTSSRVLISSMFTEFPTQSQYGLFELIFQVSFGGLKVLGLYGLDSELWFHQLCSRTPTFRELEELTIYECDKIRNLFSSSSIGALVNLKELVIDGCSQIEAVIVDDEEGEGMSMKLQFLKLEKLRLIALPKLGSFSQSKHALQFPSLESLCICNCGEMQTFAQGYINTPRLKDFQINFESFPVNDINNSLRHQFEKKHANDEEMEEVAADQITVEVEKDEKKEIMEEEAEQITTDHGSNLIFNDKN
ncbi:uncharacterized protein LOC132041664 isoform X2 [Lycium ferocissimum]|uniref:uncharacterized protein LOC132041664 isoform X2 n=1 Tax=Lycium ferocissimum TaxID=112874 RepID=UPI0028158525|nr:uncharacterized protein LOC132041664 isoform X2 [Lycium ferocissimum]